MIYPESFIEVLDNSGALIAKCIKLYKGSRRRGAGMGRIILVSVQRVRPKGRVIKGSVVRALILLTRKSFCRNDGSYISFNRNGIVLLNNTNVPIGTRVKSSIPVEIKRYGFLKIASLSLSLI